MQLADAEDLTHDFFAQALAKEWLARYDPEKGRFRTFLRTCLLAFAAESHESTRRQKRGGDAKHVALDDAIQVGTDDDYSALFDAEWTRSVLAAALEALRVECIAANRESTWRVFAAYDVDGSDAEVRPTYDSVAKATGVPPTQVTNFLNWARRRFRSHVLETIRSLTASDDEYRDEVRMLLGTDG
jgi:RNA polymerase sigma-70 factor (ECF subfamily)